MTGSSFYRVAFNRTLQPLTLTIRNRDWENWRQAMAPEGAPAETEAVTARPGHADLAGVKV